jgi:hypothetical protein
VDCCFICLSFSLRTKAQVACAVLLLLSKILVNVDAVAFVKLTLLKRFHFVSTFLGFTESLETKHKKPHEASIVVPAKGKAIA